MWRHQAGRIDFDERLSRLLQRGWEFQEYAPLDGVRGGGPWAVIGVRGRDRIWANSPERRDAWAEAMRLALMTAVDRGPLRTAPLPGAEQGLSDDPTACDEERARLRGSGWAFSEHPTAQACGREGWVVSGSRGWKRIRAEDDDRAVAWGTVLILAAATGTPAPGGLAGPLPPGREGSSRTRTAPRREGRHLERLVIRQDGSFVLTGGGLVEFVRHLEAHGTRCDPTGRTASDRGDATVPEAHLRRPFDFDRVQDLYQDWLKGRA